jgi:heme-degrading monooxygenase HmoA
MSIVRITRFKVAPAEIDELIRRRAALISAVRASFPGLAEARLARTEGNEWVDLWKWDSAESMQAALQAAPQLPEAGPAFALIEDAAVEQAEIVDER